MTNEATVEFRNGERVCLFPNFGEWLHAESRSSCELEWQQTKLIKDSPSVELSIKTHGSAPPELLQVVWAYNITEKRSFFLKAFVFWGRMALYDMGAGPNDVQPQGSIFCELELSSVLVRPYCLLPFYEGEASEYEVHARHRVHHELEFSSKWRGLEPIAVEVRRKGQATVSNKGQVCLRKGSFSEKLDRAVSFFDKLQAAQDVVSRVSAQSRSQLRPDDGAIFSSSD